MPFVSSCEETNIRESIIQDTTSIRHMSKGTQEPVIASPTCARDERINRKVDREK